MSTTLTFNPLTGNFDAVLVATATVQAWMAAPSSANLAAAVTDETGSGALVFGTAPTFTGPVTLTGVAGSSALTITGATQTASFPALNITQTWNNAAVLFTGASIAITNTASAANSIGLSVTVGSSAKFLFRVSDTWLGADNLKIGDFALTEHGVYLRNNGAVQVKSTGWYSFSASATSASSTQDVYLYRDAAGVLAQRNSTNAQTFRLYESYTDSSNYGRLSFAATAAGDYVVTPQAAGTGTLRGLQIVASGGRVGFFGTTAIAKITTGVAAATFVANTSGIVDDSATFGGYTLGQIAKALQNYGLLT